MRAEVKAAGFALSEQPAMTSGMMSFYVQLQRWHLDVSSFSAYDEARQHEVFRLMSCDRSLDK